MSVLLVVVYYFSLPRQLFENKYSTVIESQDGQLLGAKIASDGQWRFPQTDSVPNKFEKCIVAFEDRYFYKHIGFDARAFLRAIQQNISNQEIVSGGSTLSMQTIRMSRKGKSRNFFQKIIEGSSIK